MQVPRDDYVHQAEEADVEVPCVRHREHAGWYASRGDSAHEEPAQGHERDRHQQETGGRQEDRGDQRRQVQCWKGGKDDEGSGDEDKKERKKKKKNIAEEEEEPVVEEGIKLDSEEIGKLLFDRIKTLEWWIPCHYPWYSKWL